MVSKGAFSIDRWGIGGRVVELWATGAKGRAVAKVILPEVEEACRRLNEQPPSLQALTVQVDRYMATDPGDRRTKKAKNQEKAKELEVQAAGQIVKAQVDAAQTLHRWVGRIDEEIEHLRDVMEIHPLTGQPIVPSMGTYYNALNGLSKEMRGWIGLLVEMKDKLWQHEQYDRALTAILTAIQAECPPDVFDAILKRLQSDHAVSNFLGGQRL